MLGRVSYPLLSEIQDDDSRLKTIYCKYIQMSAFLTFPAMMLLCDIAKPLVLFLLGEKWASSIILIQILTFGTMTNGVIVSNLNLIRVKGRSDLILKLEIIKKSIAFSILGIAIFMNSVIAICIGSAIYGGIIALYINTYYTKKLMGYGFKDQFKDYSPYLINSGIMLMTGWLINYTISNPIIALITSIPICIAIYLGLCSAFKLYAFNEALKIVGLKHLARA